MDYSNGKRSANTLDDYKNYRAPFGIVKNTDECHGLLTEVHVFRPS